MEDLEMLAREYRLTGEKIIAILGLPEWHLKNSLRNFQFNAPMSELFRKEIEDSEMYKQDRRHNHILSNN